MAVVVKNSSKTSPSCCAYEKPCPGPHVDIVHYEKLLLFIVTELERGTGRAIALHDETLIECIVVKHRELVSGPTLWAPSLRRHVPFEPREHGAFAVLNPSGPTYVRCIAKLLPIYCRLCFLTDCQERAARATQTLLRRLESHATIKASAIPFELRTLEYLLYNLSTEPHAVVGEIARSPDVSVDIKVTVDLFWNHLVLLYAGKRRLLLYNVDSFLSGAQDACALCPVGLRSALFVHGKHEPVSKREDRSRRRKQRGWYPCPVLSRRSALDPRKRPSASVAGGLLYESRCARFCWLAALWSLDFVCNRYVLHWLYKPEPIRKP